VASIAAALHEFLSPRRRSVPAGVVLLYANLLDLTQTAALLPVLIDRLPAGTAMRTAEALARWSVQALANGADEKVFMQVMPLPAERRSLQMLRDAWQTLLLAPPEQFATRLAELFATVAISRDDVEELYRTLMPVPVDGLSGEDPFEEARRAGDLISGEGRYAMADEVAQKRKRRR
jgi:hypothetical protein